MSQLLGIIQRLISLQEQKTGTNEAPQRNFEVNGEKNVALHIMKKQTRSY